MAVPRLDPLIAAVVAKMPGAGATREQRIAWLRMIAMAMDNVHGQVGEPIEIPDFLGPRDPFIRTEPLPDTFALNGEPQRVVSAGGPATPGPAGKVVVVPPGLAPLRPGPPPAQLVLAAGPPPVTRFFIDRQGCARRDPGGVPANFAEGAGEVWFDERGEHGDLGAIVWADGSSGVIGKRGFEISAAPARRAG